MAMRANRVWIVVAVAMTAAAMSAGSAFADKDEKAPKVRPPVFEALVNCRTIVDPTERLTCYDAKVAALEEAEQKEELVLADKESMKEARRGLFGFTIPKLKIFGNDGQKEDKFELVAQIQSAYQANPGKWTIILDNGARWVQIDTNVLRKDPAPGMEIKIRKAAMGSYFANVAGQTAIRMRRVN
jgi:hypothetical protein